jgi:hypothetical protein
MNIVGQEPMGADRQFVDHRTDLSKDSRPITNWRKPASSDRQILDIATKEHESSTWKIKAISWKNM